MRAVNSLLDKHPNVKKINANPIVYAWFDKNNHIQSEGNKNQIEPNNDNYQNHNSHLALGYAGDGQNGNDQTKNSEFNAEKMASHPSYRAKDRFYHP
jgi:hypothetical protein